MKTVIKYHKKRHGNSHSVWDYFQIKFLKILNSFISRVGEMSFKKKKEMRGKQNCRIHYNFECMNHKNLHFNSFIFNQIARRYMVVSMPEMALGI